LLQPFSGLERDHGLFCVGARHIQRNAADMKKEQHSIVGSEPAAAEEKSRTERGKKDWPAIAARLL
jgi:hypothetical protein